MRVPTGGRQAHDAALARGERMTVAELRWLSPDDVAAVLGAADVFDEAPTQEWARDFLSRPGHHLCLAYVDGRPAGFVSGVEMTHPDKGTEMFLYELGVEEPYRGHGIGRALVTALADLAREHGCYGMWTLTDETNEAARRSYGSTGAVERGPQLMLDWRFAGQADG
jgi:ribosomal protein S18 acetylase RimI-like enzyme